MGLRRSTTSAPARAATRAVSSEQLSATTRTRSPGFNCGITDASVGSRPVESLCAGISTANRGRAPAGNGGGGTRRASAHVTWTSNSATGTNAIASAVSSTACGKAFMLPPARRAGEGGRWRAPGRLQSCLVFLEDQKLAHRPRCRHAHPVSEIVESQEQLAQGTADPSLNFRELSGAALDQPEPPGFQKGRDGRGVESPDPQLLAVHLVPDRVAQRQVLQSHERFAQDEPYKRLDPVVECRLVG